MPPMQRAKDSARRRTILALEHLETRELLTVIIHHVSHAPVHLVNPAANGTIQVQQDSGGIPASNPLPSNQNPNVSNPTPAELARQKFNAGFTGEFQTNRGRYANEPLQGVVLFSGGSNQSLHLSGQMQFFTYTIPGAVPTGQINMIPRNTATTGTSLVLDLTAAGPVNAQGLPTLYDWTVDSSSGGIYGGATGSGTLEISFQYRKGPDGVNASGRTAIKVTGSVVTNHSLSYNLGVPGNITTK